MSKNYELELYKLVMNPEEDDDLYVSYVDEFGWVSDKEFCVWVSWLWIKEFMERLQQIFGNGIFCEGGFIANVQEDCLCIDLCESVDGYGVDFEKVFPKEKYRH